MKHTTTNDFISAYFMISSNLQAPESIMDDRGCYSTTEKLATHHYFKHSEVNWQVVHSVHHEDSHQILLAGAIFELPVASEGVDRL